MGKGGSISEKPLSFPDHVLDRESVITKDIFRGRRCAEPIDTKRVAVVSNVFRPAQGNAGFDGEAGCYVRGQDGFAVLRGLSVKEFPTGHRDDPGWCTRFLQFFASFESEADFVFRSALAKLFREELDVRQIIKLKEIYQLLESITDKCEDVANVIEGIVLENA